MSNSYGRSGARVALVTCAELPDLDPDDQLLLAPLGELGVTAEPAVWDDPSVDWSAYDLVVLRSTWDYAPRRDEFVAWAATVPRLANGPAVPWNTDKRYLSALADRGVPVVPTVFLGPLDSWSLPAVGEFVIKPAVGAGSLDTGRYAVTDEAHRPLAAAHVARLQTGGRVVMVQPYLPAVDSDGETSLLFLGGVYSHAIRKGPMLRGPDEGVEGLYKEETITARTPSPAERAVADAVLEAVPFNDLLYARVDLIPGPDGQPLLIELELTEPSLFLGTAEGAPSRFAAAIAAAIGR